MTGRAISAISLVAAALAAATTTPASARADAVTDWNQVAAAALQSPGTATPPGAGQGAVSTAHLAMVHAAVYDAVNAIVGMPRAVRRRAGGQSVGTRRTPPSRPRRATCSSTAGSGSPPPACP